MRLEAGDAEVVVDPDAGGRVRSLRVGGVELLVQEDEVDDPLIWGVYPMVPWAGRVRDGRFTFRGEEHRLPRGDPPHAIHGVGHDRPWTATGPGAVELDLDDRWPFGGHAVQRYEVEPSALTLTMEVTAAEDAMPVVAGWHPCFRPGTEVDLPATWMWERDGDGIPTGELVSVPPGPWDDCFTGLRGPPRLSWPDGVGVTLTSSCPHWVVYTQDSRVVAVEPQTDAPDAFNRTPAVLEAGQTLRLDLTLAWTLEGDPG